MDHPSPRAGYSPSLRDSCDLVQDAVEIPHVGPTVRPTVAVATCTDCGCPLTSHDAGWCYDCPRQAQCNHNPAAPSPRLTREEE